MVMLLILITVNMFCIFGADPLRCNKITCHQDAECVRNVCACKPGYQGDGVQHCTKQCICEAVGDPHIYGFDGHSLTFPGKCRYTLTKTTVQNDSCGFNIEIQNDNTGPSGNPDVRSSWVRDVVIKTMDFKIELRRGRIILVNETLRYMPIHMQSSKGFLVIVHNGPWVVLVTSCGLQVKWDSDSTVKVKAPSKYQGKLTGLCGNCNGISDDDYKTRDGKDESKTPKKTRDLVIGDSYLVDKAGVEECKTVFKRRLCKKKVLKLVHDNCAFLNFRHSKNPFQQCISKHPRLAESLFSACTKDACHYWKLGEAFMKLLVCSYMSSFADTCAENGFQITWRTNKFCPLYCPKNMQYRPIAVPCQSTCLQPKPAVCHVSSTEGCQCIEGYLLSGDECVLPEHCGCKGWAGYIPVGLSHIKSDCSGIQKCEVYDNTKHLISSDNRLCHENAKCSFMEGEPRCHCKDGYAGDGIHDCYRQLSLERTDDSVHVNGA